METCGQRKHAVGQMNMAVAVERSLGLGANVIMMMKDVSLDLTSLRTY